MNIDFTTRDPVPTLDDRLMIFTYSKLNSITFLSLPCSKWPGTRQLCTECRKRNSSCS